MEKSFEEIIRQFQKDINPFFEDDKHDKGLMLVAYDGDSAGSEDKCLLHGILLGKGSNIVIGASKMMEDNKTFRHVIKDANEFYKFKQDPVNSLKGLLVDMLDKIREETEEKNNNTEGN